MTISFIALISFSSINENPLSNTLSDSKQCKCYRPDFNENKITSRIYFGKNLINFRTFPFVGSIHLHDPQRKGKKNV